LALAAAAHSPKAWAPLDLIVDLRPDDLFPDDLRPDDLLPDLLLDLIWG
jgi:hypothetical protein